MTTTTIETTQALAIRGVRHEYGGVAALHGLDLELAPGEFLTLLGPSGCGKTTLLRIIAGFVRPTAGSVLLGDRDMTRLKPDRRPFNMVFQRPTLFPHLDVHENVAFGLRLAKVPRGERTRRVGEALELVRLDGFARRRTHEMSGGQMQRVALARALVNRPQVLLLDEPLSALDLKIRLELEVELRRVHRETGATFVFVTHDQREALALSDRIAVFGHGRLEQVGEPDEIYRRPVSPHVARFVGDANLIPVEVSSANGSAAAARLGDRTLPAPAAQATAGPAWLVLRAEAIRIGADGGAAGAPATLCGRVLDIAFRGSGYAYRVAVDGLAAPLKIELPGRGPHVEVGADVALHWDADAAALLPREQEPRS